MSELSDISAIVDSYYDGMVRGDEDKLRHVFHPDCFVIGHLKGDLRWASVDRFIAAVTDTAGGRDLDDADYRNTINAVDITGDTAVARITNKYAGMWFTDYLSLLKHEGRWRIINKLYHHYADHDAT